MDKIVIHANKNTFWLDFKEIVHYRDLFIILAYRDIRVRYAQTFLGLLWVVLQPVTTLFIFILVFGVGIKIDTGNVPYPIFAICGISMWTYFSFVLNQSGQSIINAQEMIKKIYFPRLIIPFSKAVVGLIDFTIAILLLFVLMIVYQFPPSEMFYMAPFFILLNIFASLGTGILLSALTARYRDFQHVIPFLVQFGLYATPVAYPSNLIPEKYLWLYNLNPMAGIIQGFRWSIIDSTISLDYIWVSILVVMIIFFGSIWYFKNIQDIIADIV